MSLKHSLILAFCLVVVTVTIAERARYDNYRVYKVSAFDENGLKFLKKMETSSDSLIFLDGVHLMNKSVAVVVAPHKLPDFLKVLETNEIDFELLAENFQAHLDKEDQTNRQMQTRATGYDWTAYHTLQETYNWLMSLANSHPSKVTLIEGGKSFEKRSILGLKISQNNGLSKKPGIFVEGGIHAREWISPAVVTYIINELLTSDDAVIKDLAQNYDWYIFPHTNPDGYVHTHTTDRLWRKTRRPHGVCYGADPNRNWGFEWNTIGASNNSCSEAYAGPKPFSEIETKSLSNYITKLKGKIQFYLSLHSYSQYVLYPYGYSKKLPDNVADYKRVFNVAVAAMGQRYGTKYTGGNVYDAIYPASGLSTDWTYGHLGIPMSICIELRPDSNDMFTHFLLPADKIIPTSAETLDGVIAMVNEIKALGYFKNP